MIIETLIDFIYPETCFGCGKWGTILCMDCLERLDFVDQICPVCGEGSLMGWTHEKCKSVWGMDGLIAIYEYQEPVMKSIIDGIKYGFNRELVNRVLDNFVFELGDRFEALVPVPLYFYRENWRGFNQAEVIADHLGSKLKIPVTRILKRNRNTRQQALMKTKEEREKNIKGAFELAFGKEHDLRGKNYLLIDDVYTSGADMKECTKILKKAGASKVWGLSLAH